ncbi:alpha/beta hydrolase [Prolixibacter sp. SD074]|jgi:pimeloyl-ACP methyl ester carboxylesterase|uniref:alpha/beta hydrolase n=1 Tax=Prolixibacter sp. SD074 TaxID=2652391 RepID=UPI00127154D9|nr:alpha/beta hydrolase [Prolixibacter sp. SD074]GET28285.1 alpha/beta hydrolase [Prolixibacter sp. SD074]
MKMKIMYFKQIFIVSLITILTTNNIAAQSGEVYSNGITIAYEAFGNKDNGAIILIQGTGATMLHYPKELCQKLASKGFYVIRFDNRDIGLSTHLDSLGQPDWNAIGPYVGTCKSAPLPYTLLDMGKDVIGLLDALNIKKAHIVGASMGGAIAQLIAIHFPDRVLSLTSISASSGNPKRPQGDGKALAAMATPPPSSSNEDSLVTYLVNVYKVLGAVDSDEVLMRRAQRHVKYRNWDPPAVNRQVAAVLIGDNCDRRPELSKLKMPVMVIHGDSDPVVPLEAGKEVAATIPGAELCIINGMGHDISLKFVNQIADCIIKIVSRSGK